MVGEKKKSGRGGRREGAGRPGSNSKLYTFRAPGTLTPFIDKQENKTEFFKRCISKEIEREEFQIVEEQQGSDEEKLEAIGSAYAAEKIRDLKLPYFDLKLIAGFPVTLNNDERSEEISLLETLCPYPESNYMIRVTGNSMIDAGICSGDIIIVDKSKRNPSEHEAAVCELNGEYTLKFFKKEKGIGWLIPANPDFPCILVTEDDQFSIWGTVTYVIHPTRNDANL